MLKRGYLAANSVYACIDHTQEIVNGYFAELDPIFETIKSCEEGQDINSLLEGPICHSGFSRLN
jgi:glutamate-1-semialdehyde 2,1-aminomutase